MSIINLEEFLCKDKIGQGQSPVFKVVNRLSGKEYALKRIKRKEVEEHNQDLLEIVRLMECEHENVVKVLGYDIKVTQEKQRSVYTLYILMELGEHSLAQEINHRLANNCQMFSQYELYSILHQLLDVYTYLQKDKHIAHRDIKPHNLLFSKHTGKIQVCDFNDCHKGVGPSHQLAGTPYYMSQELQEHLHQKHKQKLEYCPFKSDVYSLGTCVLDMVELSVQNTQLTVEDRIHLVRDFYGDNLFQLVNRMLEPDPQRRDDFLQLSRGPQWTRVVEEMAAQLQCFDNTNSHCNPSSYQNSFIHINAQVSDMDSQIYNSSIFSDDFSHKEDQSDIDTFNNESHQQQQLQFIMEPYINKISEVTEDVINLYNQLYNRQDYQEDLDQNYSKNLNNILANISQIQNELQINTFQKQN